MDIETEVSAKIREYFTAKNAQLQKEADNVDVKKDNKLRELSSEKHPKTPKPHRYDLILLLLFRINYNIAFKL